MHSEFYITIRNAKTEPVFEGLRSVVTRDVTVRLLLNHKGTRSYPATAGR